MSTWLARHPRRQSRASALMRVSLAVLLVVALAGVLGGCAAPPTNAVDIHDLEFDPPVLTVPVGTTVTWTVHDETAHIIQTDDLGAKGKDQTDQFASQPLSPGVSYSHKFVKPGTYGYSDPLQGYMTGTVVVK